MRLAIILLALSLSAHAATENPDGTITLTKEEQAAIVDYVNRQKLLIAQLRDKLEEPPKPGKCI